MTIEAILAERRKLEEALRNARLSLNAIADQAGDKTTYLSTWSEVKGYARSRAKIIKGVLDSIEREE